MSDTSPDPQQPETPQPETQQPQTQHVQPEQPHAQQPPQAQQPPPYAGYQPPPAKRLVRTSDDKWLAGVCGGIARYTGLDSNLVRLLVVLGTILGFGSLIIAYIVAWILMPEV